MSLLQPTEIPFKLDNKRFKIVEPTEINDGLRYKIRK